MTGPLEDTITTVLAHIRESFHVPKSPDDPLQLILDEEGPEALVEAVLVAAGVVPAEPASHDTTHDLVIRALHFYNTGDGLTRAEVVDMAKRIESLEAAMLAWRDKRAEEISLDLRAALADLATARTLASEAAASGRFDALLGHLLASVSPPTSREEP